MVKTEKKLIILAKNRKLNARLLINVLMVISEYGKTSLIKLFTYTLKVKILKLFLQDISKKKNSNFSYKNFRIFKLFLCKKKIMQY